MKQLTLVGLCLVVSLSMSAPAFAAEQPAEIEAAGQYLHDQGIYLGDSSSNLMLDKGLTRAEMAAVLTRLHGEGEVNPDHYSWACYFTDVPDWAKSYVGYCVANLLVSGYDASRYGPNDMVTPAMASTVVLRCCGYGDGEGSAWTYGTASQYAASLGLISQSTAQASIITRGEMAVLISRAWKQEEGVPGKPAPQPEGSGTMQEYTISVTHWSREDFSQDANPDVFTATYDRALYNTIRQTLVDGTSVTAPAYTMVGNNRYSDVKNLLTRMEGVMRYEHYVPENFSDYWQYLDYFAVSATMPENYQAPLDFIQPVIAKAVKMDTDSEKVEYLNDYLCTLLTYENSKTAGITDTFAQHTGELQAACGSYARAFKFLCGAADIPCFTISTSSHTWNMVYVDGQWLHVDVSLNDLTSSHSMLLRETYPNHPDRAPEQTAFLKELLVPNSTK